VEADVRTREVAYTVVRESPDLPATEDGDMVDTSELGFTEAPADIPLEGGGSE
jgi:hypothetical protein